MMSLPMLGAAAGSGVADWSGDGMPGWAWPDGIPGWLCVWDGFWAFGALGRGAF